MLTRARCSAQPLFNAIRYSFTTSPRRWDKTPDALLRLETLETESDHAIARTWLNSFQVVDIPKEAWQASYSRSSGPGGQHVNKTNSRATIRCDLTLASGNWLPPFLLPPLSRSAYYLPNPPSLLISSQISRSASTNLSSAISILYGAIRDAGSSVIIGQTSVEQKDKVKGLMKAEKARVKMEKTRRSNKKSSRRDLG